MGTIWFCSDLHLGHTNIIKYEQGRIDALYDYLYKDDKQYTRESFKAFVLSLYDNPSPVAQDSLKFLLKQHDKMLIRNWNAKVRGDDIVWFLGDFSFAGLGVAAGEYRKQLNGHIRLIKGNHDKKPDAFYKDAGFEYVSAYPIVLKQHIVLSHAPFQSMPESSPFYYVYGHIHGNPAYQTWTKNSCCACVERHDFAPFKLDEFDNTPEVAQLEYRSALEAQN